jgi:type IV pilus assembly protein PilC
MAEQTANKRLKNVAAEACIHCTHGGTMSQVLRRYPRIFPPPVIEMIAAGEESGNLDRFLEQIANYLERQYEVAARIKGALTYPVFMLFATIFLPNVPIWVMSGPAAYFGATLQWALGIILGVIGVVAIFRLLLTVPGFALGADEVKLALPVIGKVVRQYALGKFGRTLAMLFAAGVPLSHSLEIAAAACGNRYLAKKLAGAVPELQAGGMLSEAIARTRCFPPTALHVIATGERTGNIDLMVSKIAEFAEADANTAIDQGVQLIMPICIILLGVLVCIRAAQFYTGYFNDTLSAGNAGD